MPARPAKLAGTVGPSPKPLCPLGFIRDRQTWEIGGHKRKYHAIALIPVIRLKLPFRWVSQPCKPQFK